QGLVLLEAMALGVPVVSLAAQGTIDLLAARRGALVPDANEVAFAAALERVLLDRRLAERLGIEGRAHAREWSPERCAAKLAALYDELAFRRASAKAAAAGF